MKYGVLLLVAACYSPSAKPGSPCDTGPCPSGLVCSPATLTCELTAEDAILDGPPVDVLEVIPDAPEYPPNDGPDHATDISAGGVFVANLNNAADDAPQNSCGGDGGKDVFYEITLPGAEVVYFDSFGSNFATIIRTVSGKKCVDLAAGNIAMPPCSRDACGGAQSQLALQLPGGTSCVIVDQKAGETGGALQLTVKRGGRAGTRLAGGVQTVTGDTCTGTDTGRGADGCDFSGPDDHAKDLSYFFTACPNQTVKLDASTCADSTQTHYDTLIYVKPLGAAIAACNDDGDTCTARTERPDHADGSILPTASLKGPNLFWLTVDGFAAACGGYQMVTNLR